MALALATTVVIAGGCNGSGDAAPEGRAASSTAPSRSSSTTALTSTPRALENAGDDLVAVTLSISSFRRWLLEHPRPDLLERIVRPSCSCWDANHQGLDGLATKGWRYEPGLPPYVAPEVSVRDRPGPDVAIVYVVLPASPRLQVVDASGAVVQEIPASERRGALYSLVREAGRWRIGDISEVGPVGGDG